MCSEETEWLEPWRTWISQDPCPWEPWDVKDLSPVLSKRPVSQTGWKPGFSPVSKMILETEEEFSEGSPGSCPMDDG